MAAVRVAQAAVRVAQAAVGLAEPALAVLELGLAERVLVMGGQEVLAVVVVLVAAATQPAPRSVPAAIKSTRESTQPGSPADALITTGPARSGQARLSLLQERRAGCSVVRVNWSFIMPDHESLNPNDFPVVAEKDKIITDTGVPVATTPSPAAAYDIARRLNEQAAREEEDRWSA